MPYKDKAKKAAARKRFNTKPEICKARNIKMRDRRKIKKRGIIETAKSVPCKDCGKSYPAYCMDFDHTDDNKLYKISAFMRISGMQKLLDEIAKCDVVCAICHRIRTYNRGYEYVKKVRTQS